MTNDKGIFIKNIFHMLSYAFQVLKQTDYQRVAAEEFELVQDLFAAILAKGAARQLKQGLYREYIAKTEDRSTLQGKLNLPKTVKNRVQRRQRLSCEFDELSEDNLFNQILKTTMVCLTRDPGVKPERKTALNRILVFFSGVSPLESSKIPWSRLQYQRNNQNYEMLLNICWFVLEGMLQTTEQGEHRMAGFSDEHMARLYERFILEYYAYHHTYLSDVRAAQVKWDLTGDNDQRLVRFLPMMRTDVTLRLDEQVLILDAKYYEKTLQHQFDKNTLRSDHLYQIFAYVKNLDRDHTGNVAGLLLYAKTGETVTPNCTFSIGGNMIGAKTLDLNVEFPLIAGQLDAIAFEHFGVHELRR